MSSAPLSCCRPTYLFHRLMSGNPVKMPLLSACFFSCRWPPPVVLRAALGAHFFSLAAVTGALFIHEHRGAVSGSGSIG